MTDIIDKHYIHTQPTYILILHYREKLYFQAHDINSFFNSFMNFGVCYQCSNAPHQEYENMLSVINSVADNWIKMISSLSRSLLCIINKNLAIANR